MNLHRELSSRGEDERGRVSGPHPHAAAPLRPSRGRALHDAADDGEAEGGGLPGARLRAGHEVAAGERDRDGVALHGGGADVLAPADVFVERVAEVNVGEGGDGGRDVAAGHLDRDVLVRVEVDPRVLVLVERDLGVGGGVRERVRLAVPPGTAAGAAPAESSSSSAAARTEAAAAAGAGEEAGGGARRRGGGGGRRGGGGWWAVAEVGRNVGGTRGAVGCGGGGGDRGRRGGLGVGDVGPGGAGGRHGGGERGREGGSRQRRAAAAGGDGMDGSGGGDLV